MDKKTLSTSVILLAIAFVLLYILMRAILLGYSHYTGLNKFAAIVLLATEIFIFLHTIGYLINIIRSYSNEEIRKKIFNISQTPLLHEPSVAILMAARHEPMNVLRDSFISFNNLDYGNKDIYFLDDSSEEKYQKEAEELAQKFHATLFRRQVRHGAKAGIINDCLKTLHHKYVVIFDADQCPMPQFLKKLIPIMEHDETLAFIQTPQFYTNSEESSVAMAATVQQSVFYEYICEGKSAQDAMFCCGTNVMFRKAALDSVGGLDENTVTEDFASSLKMHLQGWHSLYYEHVQAFGKAPESLSSYFKQQYRWANGTLSVLKMILLQFMKTPRGLRVGQWWEYFLSGSYYLSGPAFCILMCFPLLYLFFHVTAFFATPELYFLFFLPYIILTLSIFYALLATRNYSPKNLLISQILVMITFPAHIKAAISVLLGRKTSFGITEKTKGATMSYFYLIPQLSFIFLNFAACVWGVNKFIYERDAALLINCFWALYHCAIMSSVFYFNRESLETEHE